MEASGKKVLHTTKIEKVGCCNEHQEGNIFRMRVNLSSKQRSESLSDEIRIKRCRNRDKRRGKYFGANNTLLMDMSESVKKVHNYSENKKLDKINNSKSAKETESDDKHEAVVTDEEREPKKDAVDMLLLRDEYRESDKRHSGEVLYENCKPYIQETTKSANETESDEKHANALKDEKNS